MNDRTFFSVRKIEQFQLSPLLFLIRPIPYKILFSLHCTVDKLTIIQPVVMFSGTHGDRGMFIFPVQLTTSRIGNLIRLIHTLLYVMTIHTYIHVVY